MALDNYFPQPDGTEAEPPLRPKIRVENNPLKTSLTMLRQDKPAKSPEYLKDFLSGKNYARLLKFAEKLTGDTIEAEDLVQTTLEAALRNPQPEFQGQTPDSDSIMYWLRSLIKDSHDSLRRGRMRQTYHEELIAVPGEPLFSSVPDSENPLDALQLKRAQEGFKAMDEKKIIALNEVANRANHTKIALMTGTPVQKVPGLIREAVKEVRDILEAAGFEEFSKRGGERTPLSQRPHLSDAA